MWMDAIISTIVEYRISSGSSTSISYCVPVILTLILEQSTVSQSEKRTKFVYIRKVLFVCHRLAVT